MHYFEQSSRIHFSFKTGSHVAQVGFEIINKAGFEFVILWPIPSECWEMPLSSLELISTSKRLW